LGRGGGVFWDRWHRGTGNLKDRIAQLKGKDHPGKRERVVIKKGKPYALRVKSQTQTKITEGKQKVASQGIDR